MLTLRNFFLAACLLIIGGSFNAQAAILLSDNFNSENGGIYQLNYTGFANWNVVTVNPSLGTGVGTVDLIGNGPPFNSDNPPYDLFPGNGLYVDLDGSSNNAGELITKNSFNLTPGTYTLSFDLAGNDRGAPTNTIDVGLGGVYSGVFTRASSDPFALVTENITVTADDPNAYLSFYNLGGDNQGAILDNVTLQSTSASPVPEPSTAWLFLFAGALIVFFNRKKLLQTT